MKKIDVAVLGGDLRHNYLAKYLEEFGFNIFTFAQEKGDFKFNKVQKNCDIYIFPISTDEVYLNTSISIKKVLLEDILPKIPKNSIILAGNVTSKVENLFKEYNLEVIDYLKREELAIMNAIPTAEGAIGIAFDELPITIFDSKALVLGSGKVAKTLASRLSALGAKTLVSARNMTELAYIKSQNIEVLHLNKLDFKENFNVIFNTIPNLVLNADVLSKISKDTLIIDLASKPGGVDFEACANMSIKVIWALSLPGKVAPISSAKYIFNTILSILDELGVQND